MLQPVFDAFNIKEETTAAKPFGSGLINNTWRVETADGVYILQRINHNVFKKPDNIVHNIRIIGDYLQQHSPGYLFVRPVKSVAGKDIYFDTTTQSYFRLSPFIEQSHTIDVVQQPEQAFEAARQFGKFTQLLSGFDAQELKITLPDFHNLSLRYVQFEQSLTNGNPARLQVSLQMIEAIKQYKGIVDTFEAIKANPNFKLRVAHHDTKISNVLFNETNKGICVIDLDTVMPGYFISDVGDMLRTYLSPVSEEEKDLSKIAVREAYFAAIVQGYLGEMQDELSEDEKRHFLYAGKFMIYMQAMRFITDYLNMDVYYGSAYEGQNFVRAGNQLALLNRLVEKEEQLNELVLNFSHNRAMTSES